MNNTFCYLQSILTILLFICSLNAAELNKETIAMLDFYEEKATNFYLEELYDSSYMYSDKILSIDSTNDVAYFFIAEFYSFNGSFEKAYQMYSKSIQHDPTVIRVYYNRALASMALNRDLQFCSDVAIVNNLIAKEPDSTKTYYESNKEKSPLFNLCKLKEYVEDGNDSFTNTGIYLLDAGVSFYATLFFNEAIRINPLNDKAYYNMSLCYIGEKEEEENLLKAIQINPKNDWAHRNLGYYYYKLKKIDKAIDSFEEAADLGNIESKKWLLDNIEIKPY